MNRLDFLYTDPKTKAKYSGRMEIKNQTATSADLYFYGDIVSSEWDAWGPEDMCPQDVADFLKALDGMQTINVYINSGGGDSFAGLAIYNILKRNQAKKEVHVDALAASAASVIAMVGCLPGNALFMPPGSQLMIHNAWTIAIGNKNDFRKLADSLEKCDASYAEVYAECGVDGTNAEQFSAMQDAETWLSGTDAAKYFQNIDTSGVAIAASVNSAFFSSYKHVPDGLEKPPEEPTESQRPDGITVKISAEQNTEAKARAVAKAKAALVLSPKTPQGDN